MRGYTQILPVEQLSHPCCGALQVTRYCFWCLDPIVRGRWLAKPGCATTAYQLLLYVTYIPLQALCLETLRNPCPRAFPGRRPVVLTVTEIKHQQRFSGRACLGQHGGAFGGDDQLVGQGKISIERVVVGAIVPPVTKARTRAPRDGHSATRW